MQSVFIKNVNEYLKSKPDWNVQLIITTHSSHIVSESGFSCLRYFDVHNSALQVRDLNDFRQELKRNEKKQGAEEETKGSLKFLQQYMQLHRCDMFFADKVILIEGTVERLLLPAMIKKSAPALAHEYISLIEVGGAYAVKFKHLLRFLNVQTLIITDIDSGEPVGKHKKTPTSTTDAVTTNVTLAKWLPGEKLVSELVKKDAEEKTEGQVRVAYQIPEVGSTATGRSFEEAFILANAESYAAMTDGTSRKLFFDDTDTLLSADAIRDDSYAIADRIDSKPDFAFDILGLASWETPHYIEEGLTWLTSPNK